MFPISSEGAFEDPSIFFEQENFLEDLLADCPVLEGKDITIDQNIAKKRPRKKVSSSNEVQENIDGGGSDCKKTAHRFTERQRRQEMAALYASLRSLLPLEYVKGKRAISDHMHEAVNYINEMKKKLGEMQKRRDELRKFSTNVASTSAEDSKTKIDDSTNFVKINVLRDGMEILISSSINKERFPLSKMLQDLLERKLNVINCVSSTVASCYLHKIHIEINDATSNIDLLELQGQLENLITFS